MRELMTISQRQVEVLLMNKRFLHKHSILGRGNCRFLGMTKGRTALSLNLVVPPTIPMDVVHFSLYLPQASRGARDDKGESGASHPD
jgi:hypothetical protein